jgi:hypothetical protein
VPDDVDGGPKEHWGVPYKIKTELVTLRHIHVYAQDFLLAKHSNSSASLSHALKVKLLNMNENELTDKPDKDEEARRKKKHGKSHFQKSHRKGLWADDLGWRLIARLVSELMASNKIAFGTILASAAANNTTAALVGTVTGVARGMTEELYSFNPKALFHTASYMGSQAFHLFDSKV